MILALANTIQYKIYSISVIGSAEFPVLNNAMSCNRNRYSYRVTMTEVYTILL